MGCAVMVRRRKEADIELQVGMAAILFKKGQIIRKIPEDKIVRRIAEIDKCRQ